MWYWCEWSAHRPSKPRVPVRVRYWDEEDEEEEYAPAPYTPINTPTPWWNVPEATTANASTVQNIM